MVQIFIWIGTYKTYMKKYKKLQGKKTKSIKTDKINNKNEWKTNNVVFLTLDRLFMKKNGELNLVSIVTKPRQILIVPLYWRQKWMSNSNIPFLYEYVCDARCMRKVFEKHFLKNNVLVQETEGVIEYNFWLACWEYMSLYFKTLSCGIFV